VNKAAKFLGIPTAVLKALRQSGDFEIKRFAIPLAAYHEFDLKAFTEKLAASALGLVAGDGVPVPQKHSGEDLHNGVVSLRHVLKNYSFKSVEGSTSVVKALLEGRLKAIGMTGESVGGLLMNFEDVHPLILASRRRAFGNTLSAAEASARIECDLMSIPNLASSGYLNSVSEAFGRRYTEESVSKFLTDYVSLVAIGKEHLVASRALLNICDLHGWPLLKVPRRNLALLQAFIPRGHEMELRRLAADYRQRKPLVAR
jgi:hypothetical protein